MKKLLIGVGLAFGLLVIWCGIVALKDRRDRRQATAGEMAQFRDYLKKARQELAVHSMEETGKMQEYSRQFTSLARDAKGDQEDELQAFARYFEEYVNLNRERASMAGIMHDPVFHNFSTVKRGADLRSRREAIQGLMTAVNGVSNQVSHLETFVRTELEKQGSSPTDADRAARQFAGELKKDTDFILELCRVHADYGHNVSSILDLLESELGQWAARPPDGMVIFRRSQAVAAFNKLAVRSRELSAEERALRENNLR